MRDRLRVKSLKGLDSRLLELYDANKMKQYSLDHVHYVKDLGEGFFGKVFQGTVKWGLNWSVALYRKIPVLSPLSYRHTNLAKKYYSRYTTLFLI